MPRFLALTVAAWTFTLVPLAAALAAQPATPSAPAANAAPPTPVRSVADTLHGTRLEDPYRWLEGDAAGKLTPEVAAWTDAQNAHARRILDVLPGRAKLETRFRQLMEIPAVSAPVMRQNRYFHTRRDGSQNQAILYVRDGHDAPSRVLLDPNTLDKDGLITLAWYAPDHAGALVAFGTYRAGDENATCNILDVATGRWLADHLEGKVTDVEWLPDSSGFFYRRLADLKNPYSGQIRFHRLGQHPRQDPILFEQYKEGPLATTWGPNANISLDGRWMTLGYHTSTKSNDLWVIDLDRWRRTGEFITTEIVKGLAATSNGPINGDTLFLRTTVDAPNGRIVAVDLHNPARAAWRELIPQRPDAVIEQVSLARGLLAVVYRKDVLSRIELFDLAGKSLGEVPLPALGSASLVARLDRTEAFLIFTSFTFPTSIYRLDLRTGQRTLWDQAKVPVDPSIAEVKQVFFPSKDGTRIGMFLVHKKGLPLNGDNPTLMSGYGGFGISRTPRFSATLYPWLEAGGVFAVVNLRGGGEYGEKWHEDGMLARKQNVFDDFHAAAQWLIDNKYTTPARLAIEGGSNGGLLVGAALTQRPELFSAVVCAVPLLDMIRYHRFLMARYWVPEYGSSENPEQFAYLLKYSPYHNVKPGTRYPATLFIAGENDTRVHPLHARKMAALVQAATASDPAQKPILLWVDRESGHGGGKPLSLRLRDQVDREIFLMWQLGMLQR